jgi:pimeloyl-ACP methyl ester carboxylesterase
MLGQWTIATANGARRMTESMPQAGPTSETNEQAARAGLVLVADGVGGFHLLSRALQHVMGQGVGSPEVRTVHWGHGLGRWHSDLTDVVNHRAQAEALAGQVQAFRSLNPGSPVYLVGKSGGTGVVVWALEMLPEASVERVVLLAPALSPGYDLTAALGAVVREVVVFWSPLDVFVLGLGTRLFGTFDGPRVASAGLVGFRRPQGLNELGRARYARLRQVRWTPAMARTGYLGGHVGPDSPPFLRRYVAPLLCPRSDLDAGVKPTRLGVDKH